MARGCNVLGGSYRGRIGNVTYYVRRGQQIAYERVPRKESTSMVSQEHVPSPQQMAAAEWHAHFMNIGYVVELADLERIADALWATAEDGETRVVFDEPRGAWGFDRLVSYDPWPVVKRNNSNVQSTVIDVSIRYESYNDHYFAIDAGAVRYHDVAVVSLVGSVETGEIALHVSEPIVSSKKVAWGLSASNPQLLRFADMSHTPALMLGPRYSPQPVPYRLTDVVLSEVVGGQYTVRVWMWVKRDGSILHTFIYAAS